MRKLRISRELYRRRSPNHFVSAPVASEQLDVDREGSLSTLGHPRVQSMFA
jgi:hypothetical protein